MLDHIQRQIRFEAGPTFRCELRAELECLQAAGRGSGTLGRWRIKLDDPDILGWF